MKHLLKASFLALGLSISAFSEQVVTPGASGNNPFLDYAGVSTCRIDSSTGTTTLLCTTKPALVYGVGLSSMAANDRLSLYSTSSIVLNGGIVKKQAVATTAVISNELSFVKPILFPLGLVAKASAAPGPVTGEIVIYYREAR